MRRATALILALILLAPLSALGEQYNFDLYYQQHPFRMPGPAEEFSLNDRITIRNQGSVERSPYLDAAFTMLEEGNPFLERYNLITGAGVEPYFDFGVPYFLGGSRFLTLSTHMPDYTVYKAWQDSWYYRKDVNYLYGFDCIGFTRWVWQTCGRGRHDSISDLLLKSAKEAVFSSAGQQMPGWTQLSKELKPGALIAMMHPNYHIAMYIGTLRQFGYTARQVPELSAYLDYPLVIHSSVNCSISTRFMYVLTSGDPHYNGVTVTDGGVCVSILGVPQDEVPNEYYQEDQLTSWFELPDGTWLTALDYSNITQYAWYQ